jgi:SulP family sulfate permease
MSAVSVAARRDWSPFRLAIFDLWRRDFAGYNRETAVADVMAGLTVGAVSLPLALAFGVASGATAAAGMVTAILSGVMIGALGGAPYQISGPTGAMSAVLIVVVARYGLTGVWMAGVLSGIMLLALGLLRLGRLIQFIPSPVIAGFTTGIALIIAAGQLDNVFGLKTGTFEQQYAHVAAVIVALPSSNGYAMSTAAIVIVTMLIVPRFTTRIPASLIGIIIAAGVAVALGWPVSPIGSIPQTILLPDHLGFGDLDWSLMPTLLVPALSIAVLGAIESLLCGAVGSTMTGIKMDGDQELVAQGLANIVIPFFGGVPATAAIARTSVGIKSGGQTRVVPILHGVVLLIAALVAAPLLERIPLAALGGVLLVTSWRMNDWETLRFYVHRHLWHAVVAFVVTAIATFMLDLTQAIAIGLTLSVLWFVRQASVIDVTRQKVDPARMEAKLGRALTGSRIPGVEVVYVTGPLYFGNVAIFLEALEGMPTSADLILSMRGMPTVDASGVQAIDEVIQRQQRGGGSVHLTGLQRSARRRLERSGVLEHLGPDHIHWGADQAIASIDAARHPSHSGA